MLNRDFWEEIESFVGRCVLNMDEEELEMRFDVDADYALLSHIECMQVIDYKISENADAEFISGEVAIWAELDVFRHWEEDVVKIKTTTANLVLSFSFSVVQGNGENVVLEWLY